MQGILALPLPRKTRKWSSRKLVRAIYQFYFDNSYIEERKKFYRLQASSDVMCDNKKEISEK